MGRVLVQQPGTTTAKALSETLPKNVIIVDEDLKELRLHDGVTPGGKIIGQSTGAVVPVGTIIPFAGNAIPQGYLLCDGSAIGRTDYASLFTVIGTTYGAGDGNSTFNLPDFSNNYISLLMFPGNVAGASAWAPNGKYGGALPQIKGTWNTTGGDIVNGASGSFGFAKTRNSGGINSGWGGAIDRGQGNFDASRSSYTYSRTDHKIIPTGVLVVPIIKY